ncbi:hypothetical protein PO002_36960 [Cupriavidus necator]|uniref:hypothetical protein n=1 Tax=Cupriavidus necator TaxID=106590 RepID=UPI0039C2D18C
MIEDHAVPDPFEALADARMREFVTSLLTTMAQDEADVMRRRFDIGCSAPNSCEEPRGSWAFRARKFGE